MENLTEILIVGGMGGMTQGHLFSDNAQRATVSLATR